MTLVSGDDLNYGDDGNCWMTTMARNPPAITISYPGPEPSGTDLQLCPPRSKQQTLFGLELFGNIDEQGQGEERDDYLEGYDARHQLRVAAHLARHNVS